VTSGIDEPEYSSEDESGAAEDDRGAFLGHDHGASPQPGGQGQLDKEWDELSFQGSQKPSRRAYAESSSGEDDAVQRGRGEGSDEEEGSWDGEEY